MPLFMAMPMPFGKPDNRQPETVVLAKGGNSLQNNHLSTSRTFHSDHPFTLIFPGFRDARNYVAVAGMMYRFHCLLRTIWALLQ
jgi:hypothetical protein